MKTETKPSPKKLLSEKIKSTQTIVNLCQIQMAPPGPERDGYQLSRKGAYISCELSERLLSCSTCFGSARRIGADGELKLCATPSPVLIKQLFQNAQLPGHFLNADLDSYDNASGNCREIVKKLGRWLADRAWEEKAPSRRGLILSGPVGVGKTFLLIGLAKKLIQLGVEVKFIDFHRLLSLIRASYVDKGSEESLLAPLINAEILMIDELGKGRGNDWEQEKLDQIVMGRYNQNKLIIASTNYGLRAGAVTNPSFYNVNLDEHSSPNRGAHVGGFNPDIFESLEVRVGQRIFSRLIETCSMYELAGQDFRRKIAKSLEPSSSESRQEFGY